MKHPALYALVDAGDYEERVRLAADVEEELHRMREALLAARAFIAAHHRHNGPGRTRGARAPLARPGG